MPISALGHSRPGRASSKSGHVRYARKAEVNSEHWRRHRWSFRVDGAAADVNRHDCSFESCAYELSDYEWTAIKPMLPTSRAAFGCKWQSRAQWYLLGPEVRITLALPTRKLRICFSPYLYRARNLIERFFSKIKQCRRVANRQTLGQLSGVHQARVNPNLAAC